MGGRLNRPIGPVHGGLKKGGTQDIISSQLFFHPSRSTTDMTILSSVTRNTMLINLVRTVPHRPNKILLGTAAHSRSLRGHARNSLDILKVAISSAAIPNIPNEARTNLATVRCHDWAQHRRRPRWRLQRQHATLLDEFSHFTISAKFATTRSRGRSTILK